MSAELTACLRAANGHAISVPPRRVTVGESPGCDIPINAGYGLAAVHFRLQPWENGHFIEDAGSGLGLLINGVASTWAPLKHGDRITAGELTFVYERGNAALPSFPSSLEVSLESAGALPAAITAQQESPPSWLPREALFPPSPPPLWQPAADRKRRGTAWKWLAVLMLAAAAAAAWMVTAKRE